MSFTNYANGKYVGKKQTVIPCTDLSVMRGLGVFEVLRTYNGKANHLPLHLKRLEKSLKITGMKLPTNKEKITKIIRKLIKKNYKGKELTIQIIITGGETKNKMLTIGKHRLIILIERLKTLKTNGIKLQTTAEQRTHPEAKITNYVPAIIALKKAKKHGYDDILYADENKNALECSTSNIFIVKNKRIITPKTSVLPGITRKIILTKIKTKLKKIEKNVKIREVYNADEVFITSSTRQLTPVIKVDSHKIGNGKPGRLSTEIKEKINNYLQKINN